jgi:hypothetical protein
MPLPDFLRYRKPNAVRKFLKKLTFPDAVNLAVLIVSVAALIASLVAIKIAVKAMEHSDQSGIEMGRQLNEEARQLDQARRLLDASDKTLGDMLEQSRKQAKASQETADHLSAQLALSGSQADLSIKQVALATQEVETLQKEYGKKPNLLASFNCKGPLPPLPMRGYKEEAPEFSFSPDSVVKGLAQFPIRMYRGQESIECWLILTNDGTLDAEVLTVESHLGSLRGPAEPFLPGRYPESGGGRPPFANVTVSMLGKNSSALDGNLEANYKTSIPQVRFGNAGIRIPVFIDPEWGIDSFGIDFVIKGENFERKQFGLSFALTHPEDGRN